MPNEASGSPAVEPSLIETPIGSSGAWGGGAKTGLPWPPNDAHNTLCPGHPLVLVKSR
jgi:hypothetical protein